MFSSYTDLSSDLQRHSLDCGRQLNRESGVVMEEPPVPVEGFSEDFQLLPHQERARTWMKERETGGNAGGILADDMGYACSLKSRLRSVVPWLIVPR